MMDTNVYKRAFPLLWFLLLIATVNTQKSIEESNNNISSGPTWFIDHKQIAWGDITSWLFAYWRSRDFNNNINLLSSQTTSAHRSEMVDNGPSVANVVRKADGTKKRPIFIFSGIASNRLYRKRDGTRVWFDQFTYLFKLFSWGNNMSLKYFQSNDTVTDYGETISLGKLGNTESLEDVSLLFTSGYVYKELFDDLVKKGFTRQVNLFGIAQDWRKSVMDNDDQYYNSIFNLINATVQKTGNKAVLVCHSYGCLNLAEFIARQHQDKLLPLIKKIITLGAPWGGSIKAVQGLLSGDNLDIPLFDHFVFNAIQRTFTSLIHLIPVPEVLKYQNYVRMGNVNYTPTNISDLLNNLQIDTKKIAKRSGINRMLNAFDKLHPGVDFSCLHGVEVPTLSRLQYDGTIANNIFLKKEMDDLGDGTVSNASLALCGNKKYINRQEFYNMEHSYMIKSFIIWDIIGNASVFKD